MNRIDEYLQNVDKTINESLETKKKEKFYDTFNEKLDLLKKQISKQRKYNELLISEETFNQTVKEMNSVLAIIEVKDSKDVQSHFEGIKKILNLKIRKLSLKIQNKKDEFIRKTADLEPEMPKIYKKVEEKGDKLLMMEEENKQLLESYSEARTSLAVTRKRIFEIQHIQDLIGLHLAEQDERIDCIIDSVGSTKTNVLGSKNFLENSKSAKKLFRRFLFLFLLCLSFVLLFLHFYYK